MIRKRYKLVIACLLVVWATQRLAAQPIPIPILGGEFEKLAAFEGNPGWAEGPAFDGRGGIWFSDLGAVLAPPGTSTSVYRYDLASGELELKLEDTGGANGLLFDTAGNLLAAHGDARQITRRPTDNLSDVTIVADSFAGHPFVAPNDLVFDKKGGLYFTDPAFQPEDNSVFYLSADQQLSRVSTGLFFNNGLALSPAEDTLYVAETGNGKISAFDVADNGSLAQQRTFASLPFANGRSFKPDGMTIDQFGNLYVADVAFAGSPDTFNPADPGPKIRVWNPLGEQVLTVDVPEKAAANLLFGPEGNDYLYFTATDALWRVPIQFETSCEPSSELVGDFDGDGTVAFADFLILSKRFGNAGTYVDGDADCDGVIGFPDFLILSKNFGSSISDVAAVPEPAAMWLVMSTLPMMLRRRVRAIQCSPVSTLERPSP